MVLVELHQTHVTSFSKYRPEFINFCALRRVTSGWRPLIHGMGSMWHPVPRIICKRMNVNHSCLNPYLITCSHLSYDKDKFSLIWSTIMKPIMFMISQYKRKISTYKYWQLTFFIWKWKLWMVVLWVLLCFLKKLVIYKWRKNLVSTELLGLHK